MDLVELDDEEECSSQVQELQERIYYVQQQEQQLQRQLVETRRKNSRQAPTAPSPFGNTPDNKRVAPVDAEGEEVFRVGKDARKEVTQAFSDRARFGNAAGGAPPAEFTHTNIFQTLVEEPDDEDMENCGEDCNGSSQCSGCKEKWVDAGKACPEKACQAWGRRTKGKSCGVCKTSFHIRK